MRLIKELEKITNQLIKAKESLDEAERYIALKKAQIMMSTYTQYTNAEAREANVTLTLENDEKAMLDALYDLRGEVRKLTLLRECLIEKIKQSRANSIV